MDEKTQCQKDNRFLQCYTFFAVPVKITVWFFIEFDILNLKFIWKAKGPRIAKSVSKKKIKYGPSLLGIKA